MTARTRGADKRPPALSKPTAAQYFPFTSPLASKRPKAEAGRFALRSRQLF